MKSRRARAVTGSLLAAATLALVATTGCGGTEHRHPEPQQPPPDPAGREVLHYRNPMDPTITSPVPAKDSMGMDYVPVYADEVAPEPGAIEGLATVTVGGQQLRLAGVRTAVAGRGSLGRAVRAVGRVTADETRIRHVHTKISGWIEELFINFTGQAVRRGEPILSIYSPQLLATQEEFLRAREIARRFADSELPEVRRGGEDLLSAARRRLELLDVPASFLEELERSGEPQRTVVLLAPVSGFVTAKAAFEGQEVQPGMELFAVTDLSRVWVEADFYEYEAPALRPGQEATVLLPYQPDLRLRGRVTFIYPTVDPDTRTVRARLDLDNPRLALKPGMFANVSLDLDTAEGTIVPDSAIIDTGQRQLLFVEREPGVFEPREVRVLARSGGDALLREGVESGERVVVRANFLLDSESRLRAALAAVGGSPDPGADER